jgi:hypothetical protein
VTTAPIENRGGANGGPQYNPANVNGQGGNGQSGQANPNYTGFPYGQNGQLETQAGGASMAAAPTMPRVSQNAMPAMGGGVTPLDELEPDGRPISDGVDFGSGRGSEALPSRVTSSMNQNENLDLIKRYLPDLINATRIPNAPDSYKRFVNYLKEQIL